MCIIKLSKFLVLITALFILTTVVLELIAGSVGAQESITIGWQPGTHPRYYTTRALEIFKKVGLEPKWIKFASGPPMLSALQSGAIDVGSMGTTPALFGIAQGIDMKYIAVEQDGTRAEALIVWPESDIQSLKDLQGKKIGVTVGSSSYMALVQALETVDMTTEDLNILDMQPMVILPAFANKDIDGAWVWEPWLGKIEDLGGKITTTTAEIPSPGAKAAGTGIWVARTAWLTSNPDMVQKFLKGLYMAEQEMPAHKDEVAAAMAETIGVTKEGALRLLERAPMAKFADQLGTKMYYSMGSSATKANSPFANNVQALADLLFQQKRLPKMPDIPEAMAPKYLEEFMANRKE